MSLFVRSHLFVLATCAVLLGLTGCAGTQPLRYADLPVSRQLRASDSATMPFQYATPVNWRDYSVIVIDPIAIYSGADHQFADLADADKRELARAMEKSFRQALSSKFGIASDARPNGLRLKLTLTGASTNTAVVSTFTRFDIAGLPYNAVQSLRGKEGIFMGSVSYSVEIYDAMSDRLLMAYVTKQYPNAMNVGATVGALSAARTGLEKGAQELLTQLQ